MRYHGDHRSSPPWGSYFASNAVNKLIIATVAVYIVEQLFRSTVDRVFALSPRQVVENLYIWQPLTYMFLHGGPMHLFFNMLMTWFLGSALESVWGGRRFLKYYVACGLGGAAFTMLFTYHTTVIGASGAVFGLYLAYAILFPNNYIYIYFLFPIKAKYLVAFLALFQLAQGVSGPSGIAYFAHLGGMAGGLLFFRREMMATRWGWRTRRWWNDYSRVRKEEWKRQEGEKIDSILDKIASKGYEHLSTTERRILENYSRKQKDDSE